MNLVKISAFSDNAISSNKKSGNPAGVYISDKLPADVEMQAIAHKLGYSETAFAEPCSNVGSASDHDGWRVRYFSPESEVPFCGHATIALGAAIAMQNGAGVYPLQLNETAITVEGFVDGDNYSAALQSPATHSESANPDLLNEALTLFGYTENDLDPQIPPAFANAGANHLIIALNSRSALANMNYDLDEGRIFMNKEALVTVMFVYVESPQKFHSRNAFASGGVLEDPATGAASAAFAAYLRDIKWPHNGSIDIVQGEDMGSRSLIKAEFNDDIGSSIRVSGAARIIL